MEILATIVIVLLPVIVAAAVSALLGGPGHTPPVESHEAWSALDLSSPSYTLRIF
jgi:flagellar motor switch protein FliM